MISAEEEKNTTFEVQTELLNAPKDDLIKHDTVDQATMMEHQNRYEGVGVDAEVFHSARMYAASCEEEAQIDAENQESEDEKNSQLQSLRQMKLLKYKRCKEYCDLDSEGKDEVRNEVISKKDSKISVSELVKLWNAETYEDSKRSAVFLDENESSLQNDSVDETMLSYDNSAAEARYYSTSEPSGFCMDFMSLFSDFDLRDIDDDFGSASLFQDESRAVTWVDSVVAAVSKDETPNNGTTRSTMVDYDQAAKGAGYESELANSLDDNERRRLTFSFSDGRYTASLSSSNEYRY
jgi:hypothetical protein